jgi:glycosyltransferase involved in cell wall biosynthesis
MRMLFVCTTSATVHTFLLSIAKYERDKGHDISFACSFESFADAKSAVDKLREADFVVHEIPFAREISLWKDLMAFWSLTRLIHSNNYDLVHTFTSKAGFIGRAAAKAAGCPNIIHTVLGFEFQRYNYGMKKTMFIFLEKVAALFCNRILFISDFTHKEAIRYRLKEDSKLTFVGLTFDSISQFKKFHPDLMKVREQYVIPHTDMLVGSVGRLVYQKGMDTFIRAAALLLQKHSSVTFIIAGSGSLLPELKALAHSLGIADKVKFVGSLNTEQIMHLMSSLDVFVLSTRFEGLGLVYLEAMALQCPVIGSRISPVKEVIREGETGLLATVDDPEDFAQAISRLLDDPNLRRKMGKAGPAYVESKFSVQAVLERYDKIYQEVVAKER